MKDAANVCKPPSMWQLLFADVCWHDLEAAYMWPGCWSTCGSWSCSGYVRAVISVVERSIGTIKQSGSRDAIAPFFAFYLSRTILGRFDLNPSCGSSWLVSGRMKVASSSILAISRSWLRPVTIPPRRK